MKEQIIVSALTQITERLADVIASENHALKDRRPSVLAETLAEKEQLTSAYEGKMQELNNEPRFLERLQVDEVDRLKTATSRFQDALEDHRRLVQATKSVTERMLREITREVSKRQNPVSTYDQQAGMQNRVMGKAQQSVTLAYNQTI